MRIAPSILPLPLLVALSLPSAPAEEPVLDTAFFLRRVADLDRLARLEDGVVSRQFSSYHRGSRYDRETGTCVGMDINGDAGFLLTVHSGPDAGREIEAFRVPPGTPRFRFGDLEWVLDPLERNHVFFLPRPGVAAPKTRPPEKLAAAIPGPGCIVRIWSANPMGTVRFYLDGSETPLELDFQELFAGGAKDPDAAALARRAERPFLRPFTFRREGDGDALASDCYLPIPFAESCLVTLDSPSFYHFGYETFPAGTKVRTFRLPLSDDEVRAFDETARKLLDRGKDPKPELPGTLSVARRLDLAPGEEATLADLTGPGCIRSVHARLTGRERYAGSKVLLQASFDGESKPSVWSPLVNFFGTGFEPRDFRSLPLGYIQGEGYCYFPMPYRTAARLTIRNEGKKPARLVYRIAYAPVPDLPADVLRFKCKYRREEVSSTFDYPFLECVGRGRFVGASLSIDDAWRSWWGEGDEKIWVDRDVFPSFFGTGSEDYFGDAWGIRKLQESFFACSFDETNDVHSWTSCYRWHVPDDVPFRERFRATIENYPETLWGSKAVDWDEDYVSTAYWYQAPGGTDFFEPVPVEKRRPWGKVPAPPVVEAEEALAAEVARGATIVDDEALPREVSRGLAIDLGAVAAGRTVELLGPKVIAEGPYAIRIHRVPGAGPAAGFEVLVGGEVAGASPADPGRGDATLAGVAVFPLGRTPMALRFTSPGRAVLDAIQLLPAREIPDAVEAERLRVVDAGGRDASTEVGVLWSGGRRLRFAAAGPGDALELEVTVPPGSWNLKLGLCQGPDLGDWDAFVGGKPVAELPGWASEARARDGVRLGSLRGQNGPTRLKFVCRGKSAESTGHALGLDWIGWTRIVVDNAIEAETAEATDVRGGGFVPQNLGPAFSGESHLWFHPAKPGASFVLPLDVKEAGRHDLAVYFTKSFDYAIVRVSLDGKDLGTFDTYAPGVEWGGKTSLGSFDLERGKHRLCFEIAGKNAKSQGILMGVDCLTIEKRG